MALRNNLVPRVMSGARARVSIFDPNTGFNKIVGIFNSISYGVTYDVLPAFILGRYSAAELDYTGAEPVNVTAGGWRAFGLGPHQSTALPKLSDLLNHQYITLTIYDRQNNGAGANNKPLATIKNCRPTGFATAITARQLEELTVTFLGLLVDDEDTENAERFDSTTINLI